MIGHGLYPIAVRITQERGAKLTQLLCLALFLFFYMTIGCAPVSQATAKSDFKFLEFFDPY